MIILIFLLLLFICTTAMLGWYCYKLANKLLYLSDNMEELYVRLDEFDQHINFIYELELYYGDETLKNLIRHSRDLRNYMKNYRDVIELAAEDDADGVIDDDIEKAEDDEENQDRITTTGKTVFYQGT